MVFMPMGFKINLSREADFQRIGGKGYLPEDIPLLESFKILQHGEPVKDINLSPEDYRKFINWLGKGPQQPIPDVVLRILCHYKSIVKDATEDVNTTDGMRLKQTNLIKTIEELIKGGDDNKDPDTMCLGGGATKENTAAGPIGDCCEELKDGITRLAEKVDDKMEKVTGDEIKDLLEAIKAYDLRAELLKILGSPNGPASPGEPLNSSFQTNVRAKLKLIEDALTHPLSEIKTLESIIEKGFKDLKALIEGLKNLENHPGTGTNAGTGTNVGVGTDSTNATNIKSLVETLNSKIAELSGILSVLKPAEGSTEEFNNLQSYLKTKFDSVISAIQSIVIPAPDLTQLEEKINGLFSTMVESITKHISEVSKGGNNSELIALLTELKTRALSEADIQKIESLISKIPRPPEDISKNIAEIKTLLKAGPPINLEAISQLIKTHPSLKDADKEAIRALLNEMPKQIDYTQILQEILGKPASPSTEEIKNAVVSDLTQSHFLGIDTDLNLLKKDVATIIENIGLANKNINALLGRKMPKVDLAALGDKAVAKFAEAEKEVESALRKLKEMDPSASANTMEELERDVIKLQAAAKIHAEQAEELYALNSDISSASAEGGVEQPPAEALQAQSEPPSQKSAEPSNKSSQVPRPSAEGLPAGWEVGGPDDEGDYWYYNETTGESKWNRPMAGGAGNNTRRRKKEAVNQRLANLNTEMNGFRRRISLKRQSNSNARAALEAQLEEFRANLASCEEDLARLKKSVSSSSSEAEEKEKDAAKLLEKITQLKKIIAKVIGDGKENAQYEPLVDAHMKAFSDLEAERNTLHETLRRLTADCAGKDAQINALKAESLTQKTEYEHLQAQLAGTGTNVATIAELRVKLAECERRQAETAKQKEALEREKVALTARLAEAQSRLAVLERLKAVIKHKVTGEVTDDMIEDGINTFIKDNEAKFAKLESERARLATEVGRLSGLLAQKEGEITRLTLVLATAPRAEDKARLERELAECREAYARLKAERDAIDDMNRQITIELETYRQRNQRQEAYPPTSRPSAQAVPTTTPSYMASTASSKGRMDAAQGQLNQLYGKGAKGATWVNYNARAKRRKGGKRTRKGARL